MVALWYYALLKVCLLVDRVYLYFLGYEDPDVNGRCSLRFIIGVFSRWIAFVYLCGCWLLFIGYHWSVGQNLGLSVIYSNGEHLAVLVLNVFYWTSWPIMGRCGNCFFFVNRLYRCHLLWCLLFRIIKIGQNQSDWQSQTQLSKNLGLVLLDNTGRFFLFAAQGLTSRSLS